MQRPLIVLLIFALTAPAALAGDIPVPYGLGKDAGQAMDTGDACKANADCKPKHYCAKPAEHCDDPGKCRPQPDFCIQVWDPVCGCDGKTHSNAGCAAVAGTNVKHLGECKSTSD